MGTPVHGVDRVGPGPSGSDPAKSRRGVPPLLCPNQVVTSKGSLKGQNAMILRSCTYVSLLLVLSAITPQTASAAEDNASAVLADCTMPDLPAAAVDSCLERVRVVDETNPSPQLQSLEAQLEQREAGPHTARRQPGPPRAAANPMSSDTTRYDTQPMVVENPHYLPPEAAEPDQNRPAATEESAIAMPDERGGEEEQGSVQTGAERPPAGINDDQPPIADPPDGATSRDLPSDPPDDQQ